MEPWEHQATTFNSAHTLFSEEDGLFKGGHMFCFELSRDVELVVLYMIGLRWRGLSF